VREEGIDVTVARRKRGSKPTAMTPEEFRAIIAGTGLTQTGVADRIGYTRVMVCRWANGRSVITEVLANHIKKILTGR
jgi:DNA-binding transcriptional regulator YiaG